MKIAVDCRYLGKSGIGRVCEGIIDNLNYTQHKIYLIGKETLLNKYSQAIIVPDETDPFSPKGLLHFQTKKINRECDCIIIPNFIIPYGIKIPVHTVMHDLIFLDVKETVNGKIDYFIKKTLLKRCMKKSKTIACVSAFTKSRCEYHFKKHEKKCYVNHIGLANNVLEFGRTHIKPAVSDDTIVYVGNVKRHKGLQELLSAFEKIEDNRFKLKIIGEKDHFLTGLEIDEARYQNVEFTGRICDEELFTEIQNAKYLVLLSKYEGFGLPPLEAMYLGTQPIISDIEVFKEIYEGFPVVMIDEVQLKEVMYQPPQMLECKQEIVQKYNYANFTSKIIEHICYAF